MIPQMGRLHGIVLLCALCMGSCAPANGPYMASVAPELHPRLSVQDAIKISRGYLDDQTPELAAPELHSPPRITSAWAVRANDASTLDGCIPIVPGDQIVWVTKGQGDYLNLSDHPWSTRIGWTDQLDPNPTRLICESPGPLGTLVIDDATGAILGVYPESPGHWHPSPMPHRAQGALTS
jgi:hypothetical protein